MAALLHRAVLDLREAAPEIVDAITPFMDDPELAVRMEAVGALTRLGALPATNGRIEGLAGRLRERLGVIEVRQERAVGVLALGHLGADTSSWLDDADPAVRACAALSCRDDTRSTTILIEALTNPRAADGWFTDGLPLIQGRVRFRLLHEVLARGVPLTDLLPAALAIVQVASSYTADADWGPLLQAAFPDVTFVPGVRPPPPTKLDGAQRALLRALVANESLWDPTNGNASLARMRVGLPDERKTVAELAQ